MSAHEDVEDPAVERDQLRQAMENLPGHRTGQGMFMLLRSWSADQSFAALKTISQYTNVKLHEVATVIVAAGSHVEPSLPDREAACAVLAETRRSVLGSPFGE
ncbi:ANTAR domain-containing protein [Amycolatopsis keratiniphila]|uniref:ANTAR domain-containing protein n=1 Tax=Amycolatopsis keratiniphila TaxID=129921 RepID=UPI00087DF3EE|nr:ANTAR domain-containing protein [Amycolatopsis keratiniphila]OLZ50334.1 ANTAR domain-containing protein [Amycolatopsis keratiniphila subsp. nogabecina]SDU67418.1 ANTAR domain-containing protein [Amycolatopsis keratiniphila]